VREEQQEPEVQAVEKQPNAHVVLVVGDFLAGGLAEGLEEAFVQTPTIRVIERTNGSSGFVRDDFYNWPEEIRATIETEKPAVVIAMIGSNDGQQMRVGDKKEEKATEAWAKEYEVRATNFAHGVRQSGIPLIWVGMPAFKSNSMTSDMLAFNDIYQRVAESVKGEFVDIWDGFVDENGAFITTGPDVNGQPERLRSRDGINFTKAGKRKIAFYVEKPLNKILGTTASPMVGTLTPGALPGMSAQPSAVPAIDRTVPISLSDPELDGGSELLGLTVTPKREVRTPGERLVIEGVGPAAKPGRADDFARRVAPARPIAPPTSETTSAVGR
jgi:uncharacterized protein